MGGLISAAGIINTWQPQARATATAWSWKRFGSQVADRGSWFLSRPRTREALLGPFIRCPSQLAADVLWEQIDGGVRGPGFGDALKALVGYDARERLGSIEQPTLVLAG
jgi:pimeloyl-ACP methyl ester carboxylesterase